jgi:hypothetical protein
VEPLPKDGSKEAQLELINMTEPIEYMLIRATQMLRFGFKLISITKHKWGLDCTFVKDGKEYQSIYLLKEFTGKGLYKTLVNKTILTSFECNIVDYLIKNRIPHECVRLSQSDEYHDIDVFYGNEISNRSHVRLMNHIDEGLAILEWIGASDEAKRAYCLHPIYQSDETLPLYCDELHVESSVLVRAMEYRSVANEYLSKREIQGIEEIRLSPLKDVNDMLIADKIQNRKDFEIYHEGKHPRSKELAKYFRNWLERLGVSEETYQDYKQRLTLDVKMFVKK